MKTIIICLFIILIFSGYKALTSDNKQVLPGIPATSAIQQKPVINNGYIVEITEEEDDE